MSKLNVLTLAEQIPNEAAAYEYLEGLRWPDGPECPHCGNADRCYFLTPREGARKTRTGNVTQRRLWKCGACRKQFSVLTGTVMHGTKIAVRTWVFVLFEMVASKNGVSAREIERKYGITNRAAWFLTHRIREAMANGGIMTKLSGTIVADETWVGGKAKNKHGGMRYVHKRNDPKIFHKNENKTAVLTILNTESGEARSRVIPNITGDTLADAIRENVEIEISELHTDEWRGYWPIGREFAKHAAVHHSRGEYVRDGATTNHVEGFFSQLKRSLDGTHHHVSGTHLARYLSEFDFRFSTRALTDADRMRLLVERVGDCRLAYETLLAS